MIPKDVQRVIPYLMVQDVATEMAFIEKVFDGVANEKITNQEGNINHGEIRIGDCMVMLGCAGDAGRVVPAMLYVYVEDVDATYQKALNAGGTSLMEPAEMFYGDRNAGAASPQGIQWWIGSRTETLSSEEIQKRALEPK